MEKIEVKLIGEDGNVFNLISIVKKALIENDQKEKAKEMQDRIYKTATSYTHALSIIQEYVDIV